MSDRPGRLVLLTGPSCVGKTPLTRALRRFHPDLAAALKPIVLATSRAPRPGEQDGVDFHFRTRAQVEAARADPRRVVLDVRGDLQALDLEELRGVLAAGDALYEGNPHVGRMLQEHPALQGVPRLALFLSPLSREEVLFLRGQANVSFPALVSDVQRRKLLRRMRRQKGELSLRDLEEAERRAGTVPAELALAHLFDHVIPNHDGEDSDDWDAFYHPLGDARRTLLTFAALLRGDAAPGAERWAAGDVPPP